MIDVQKSLFVLVGAVAVAVIGSYLETLQGGGADNFVYKDMIANAMINGRTEPQSFSEHIQFRYYKNNVNIKNSNGFAIDKLDESGCTAEDRFAFILHGWQQTCRHDYVIRLIEKLTERRGGCIVCIDYSKFGNGSYTKLLSNFERIENVVVDKIKDFQIQGFRADKKGYMFGFSLGGQLATAVGKRLKPILFRNIDTCDMAGPGFDNKGLIDHRSAAQNVQCVHTTRDFGTRFYNCHQNIRMGNCGYSQPGAGAPPYTSHGLCVQMYISAFDNDFFVIPKPAACPSTNPAKSWPDKLKMGYMETRMDEVRGELFVPTQGKYPYTVKLHNK